MCSQEDDTEEQENSKFMQEKPKFNLAENKCMKCRENQPKLVLHSKYPYCQSCFIAGTVHKFKALLGKNRVVHPNDTVLVRYRAGHPSTALLHFLRTGLDVTTPKRIRFKPIVVFVENHHYLPLSQRKEILKQVDHEVSNFSFPLYFVSLTQYVLNPGRISSILQEDFEKIEITEGDATNIKNTIKKNANATTRQEILKIYERDLLVSVAEFLNCKCIFTPEAGINIASQLLTSISLGRGAHAVFDMGTVDSRNTDLTFVRPLRNFSMKELAFYNILNNLEPVSFLNVPQNPYSSVHSLMEKFVSDLQVNYPATVSTIVRTGDKLCVDKKSEQNEKCPICKVPVESEFNTLGSAEATKFSHWVSTEIHNPDVALKEQTAQLLENFNNRHESNHCFACSRIVNFLLK